VTQLSGYSHGKLADACKGLNAFWADRSTDLEIDSGDFWKMVHDANAYVSLYLQGIKHPELIDLAAMRLISALLAYLSGLKSSRRIRYTDVTDTVQREVRNYINLSLITRFNADLPDPLDKISVKDIRNLCQPLWADHLHPATPSVFLGRLFSLAQRWRCSEACAEV
jgi:hypothetical protein